MSKIRAFWYLFLLGFVSDKYDLTQTLLRHLVKKMVSGASDWHKKNCFAEYTIMGKESTRLTLRWDNFQANLQDTWRQLHQSEDFADVILACDVGQVRSFLDCLNV